MINSKHIPPSVVESKQWFWKCVGAQIWRQTRIVIVRSRYTTTHLALKELISNRKCQTCKSGRLWSSQRRISNREYRTFSYLRFGGCSDHVAAEIKFNIQTHEQLHECHFNVSNLTNQSPHFSPNELHGETGLSRVNTSWGKICCVAKWVLTLRGPVNKIRMWNLHWQSLNNKWRRY